MIITRWVGQRRNGTAGSGAAEESPAVVAERLFDQRWRWADLHCDGKLVGGVGLSEGKRTWWAEADAR